MRSTAAFLVLLSTVGLAFPLACAQSGDAETTEGSAASGHPGDSASGAGAGDPGCVGPLGAPVDPETLTACCPDFGGAHCVEKVPADLEAHVGTCDGGGYCVPDPFISTGGVFTPKACKAFDGSAGVCLSACIPEIGKVATVLSQDVCDASERCAPCDFGGKPTGACDIKGECEGQGSSGTGGAAPSCDDPATCLNECPPIDPSGLGLTACTTCGGAHCVPTAQVPDPMLLAELAKCDDTSVCVPDDLIATSGKFIPATCKSVSGVEGRCLSKCLPQVADQAAQLPQDTCPETHACVPCYDPLSGMDTGACKISCDPGPAGPPQTFAKCCKDMMGTCIPAASVPPEQQAELGPDSCPQDQGAAVCVPDPFLEAQQSGMPFVPETCETSFFLQFLFGDEYKDGACLPECIPQIASAPFLEQDVCPDNWKCAPCKDPQTGQSSGACDPQG